MNGKKKILIVVGTRPNFIKVTRFKKVAALYPSLEVKIVHTGQHYDHSMSEIFFKQFNLVPDYFLEITHSTSVTQLAHIIEKLEYLLLHTWHPDMVLVVGDVDSTLAASVAASKLNIKLAHIESGLRSFDRTMPEENNRIITDAIADYFFVTEQSGINNLLREGKERDKIFFTGNTMIDTMVAFQNEIAASPVLQKLRIVQGGYILVTMHRPANVDTEEGLEKLTSLLLALTEKYTIVFPVHPRTIKNAREKGYAAKLEANKRIILTEPFGYFDFQKLVAGSKIIITDSGGIQEESTFLGIPCFTLRKNTERPVTCESGTNTLLPFENEIIFSYIRQVEEGTYRKGEIPEKWDGKATERIMNSINTVLNS